MITMQLAHLVPHIHIHPIEFASVAIITLIAVFTAVATITKGSK